jgi:hypothetical protein
MLITSRKKMLHTAGWCDKDSNQRDSSSITNSVLLIKHDHLQLIHFPNNNPIYEQGCPTPVSNDPKSQLARHIYRYIHTLRNHYLLGTVHISSVITLTVWPHSVGATWPNFQHKDNVARASSSNSVVLGKRVKTTDITPLSSLLYP